MSNVTSKNKQYGAGIFLAISFIFSFLILAPLFRLESPLESVLMLFLYILGGFGPTLAAILLTWLEAGASGVSDLLKKAVHFRVKPRWYIAVLLIPLLTQAIALGIMVFFSDLSLPIVTSDRWLMVIPFFFFNLFIFGALGQELGWRGYLLPRLQAEYSALVSSLLIGVFWAIWLLPRTFIVGSAFVLDNYLWVVIELVAVSILLTWLTNSAGSLAIPILFHAVYSTIPPVVAPILEISGNLAWYQQITATVYTNLAVIILLVCGATHLVYKPRPKRVRPE